MLEEVQGRCLDCKDNQVNGNDADLQRYSCHCHIMTPEWKSSMYTDYTEASILHDHHNNRSLHSNGLLLIFASERTTVESHLSLKNSTAHNCQLAALSWQLEKV